MTKNHDILVIGTTCLEIPPDQYGGTELIIYNLCKGLNDIGFTVTCAAPIGTEIEGVDVIETVPPSQSQNCFNREPEAFHKYKNRLDEFDVIIDHSWRKHSYMYKSKNESMSDIPIIGVWHGSPSIKELPPVENPCYASVSKSCAESWQKLTGTEVRYAHNGIDPSEYELRDSHWENGDYYLTLNRIMPEKGIKEFMEVCETAKADYIVAGEDSFVSSTRYVHEVMEKAAKSDRGKYLGTVEHEKKKELLRNAKATVLTPLGEYEEAFGLAAVESMLCGTPVLVLDNSGLSEVVGTLGNQFVKPDLDALAGGIAQLNVGNIQIEPHELRQIASDNFSISNMTNQYGTLIAEAMNSPW